MKKSKILMPLTGIAAIGAFAPVIAMSSCNKNEYKLINKTFVGNVIDTELQTGTNRVGYETFESTNSISMGASTTTPLAADHEIYYTIAAKGSKTKDGTAFYVNAVGRTKADIDAGEQILELDTDCIQMNEEKLEVLYKNKATESFTFTVVFEEYDTKNKKVVGTQSADFTLVACPALHDLPKFTGTALTGTTGSTLNVTLGGWSIAEKALADITVGFKDTGIWPIVYEEGTEKENKLTVDGTKTSTVQKDGQVISFKGTLTRLLTTEEETAGISFPLDDEEIVLTFKTDAATYVESGWEYTVKTGKSINVTAK